jgi:hypothetical protein
MSEVENVVSERDLARQSLAKPVPPARHLRRAGMHWLERFDCDGHAQGLEVFQWQPQAQQWCRPNGYATYNGNLSLNEYVYIGPCILPALDEDRAAYQELRKELESAEQVSSACHSKYLRIDRKHYARLRELLYELE